MSTSKKSSQVQSFSKPAKITSMYLKLGFAVLELQKIFFLMHAMKKLAKVGPKREPIVTQFACLYDYHRALNIPFVATIINFRKTSVFIGCVALFWELYNNQLIINSVVSLSGL